MKRLVVDAMTLADRQHSACIREAMAYFKDDNNSETGRCWVKEGLRRDSQYRKFRRYILRQMGADDD